MGVQEFNYLDSYEEIAQKVVKYYNAYPGNQRQIEWHQVQFFNGEFNIVSYYDYNIMATSENQNEIMYQLLTREQYLNFLILDNYSLDKADAHANVKYQVFMEDDI